MILVWRITSTCNFGCSFCAYDRGLSRPRASADPAEVRRFALLLADCAARRGDRLLLSWLGGEPLLWKPLLPLSRQLARHPAIAISATSNGSRLDSSSVRNRILADFAELTLSVDGLSDTHDRLRAAPGSFARIEHAIARLVAERAVRGSPLRIRVNTILMRDTFAQFPALCHRLADWGVDEITFNQLGGRDRPEFHRDQRLGMRDACKLRDMLPVLRAELAPRGMWLCAGERYLDRIVASSQGMALAVDDCGPGEMFLFVDEAGVVAPCSFTQSRYGIPVSELRTDADVLALPARFRRARSQARDPQCDDCPSTQIFGKFAA